MVSYKLDTTKPLIGKALAIVKLSTGTISYYKQRSEGRIKELQRDFGG